MDAITVTNITCTSYYLHIISPINVCAEEGILALKIVYIQPIKVTFRGFIPRWHILLGLLALGQTCLAKTKLS